MATTGMEPFLKGDGGRNTRGMLRIIILCTIAAAAVASRLFSVIRKSTPSGSLTATAVSSPAHCGLLLLAIVLQRLTDTLTGFESIIHECESSCRVPASSAESYSIIIMSAKLT